MNDRVKVLITASWARRLGGAEMMLWVLLQHLNRRRVEPLVVFFEPGPFEREVSALGIRTTVLPAGRLRQMARFTHIICRLAELLRHERPHILLNWSAKAHLYGAPAAALTRVPQRTVWWQHMVPVHDRVDRLATLLPASAVVCSSDAGAQAQSRLWPRRPTFTVCPGIAPPAEMKAEERRALRRHLAIPEESFVVGIVGRLQPWKGQHHVIHAVAELRRRKHNAHALIVGGDAFDLSPTYGPALRALMAELGVADAVTFTGQVNDAGPFIDVMDAAVNASAAEPFGIVLLEAMARGVPVVAVNAAGPAEIVEPGRSGTLVSQPDGGLIAAALERLIVDSQLRRRLADGAKRRFQTNFTAERMARRFEERIESLLDGTRD